MRHQLQPLSLAHICHEDKGPRAPRESGMELSRQLEMFGENIFSTHPLFLDNACLMSSRNFKLLSLRNEHVLGYIGKSRDIFDCLRCNYCFD